MQFMQQRNVHIILCVLTMLATACAPQQRLSARQEAAKEQKVQWLLAVATAEIRVGDDEALTRGFNALELARDMAPRDPRVLDGLGCIEWHRGNYKLARHFFNRALELDPNYDRGYVHLALLEEQQGQREEAAQLLRTAIELNPLNYRARNNYAALLIDKKLPSEAKRHLQRALFSGGVEEAPIERNLELVP